MPISLRELDLGSIFISSKVAPDLPPEIFARRAARGTPSVHFEPADSGELADSSELALERRSREDQDDKREREALEPELPPPGWVLGGYRLERAIGMGGFGAVYRARHVVAGDVVAIKLMRPSVVRSRPELLRLLAEEARFAAQIDHANVVRVHDVATSNEHTYIIMEHVDGFDLRVMIKRRGALPYMMVIRILRHIAAALAAGLAENVIHRDVKPSNILLTRAGVTKLADFGLARSISAAETTGVRGVGTAAYMAPEQASDPRRVGYRSDIYSLGVTAYHALTGGLPFSDHDPEQLAVAHRTQPVVPPSRFVATIPPSLDDLVIAMMAKHPDDRPASYAALDAELRAIR